MRLAPATIVLALAALAPSIAHASQKSWECWSKAGERYGVDPALLYAVARVETKARSGVVVRNSDGSYDLGVMQINSSWLPKLKPFGITAEMLRDKPCLNVMVGAWILSQTIHELGLNWKGVGAYNARTESKRASYARKVAAELRRLRNDAARTAKADASADSGVALADSGS